MTYRFAEFVLDARARLLLSANAAKPLSEKLCEVLRMLVEADGAIVPKDEFATRIWSSESFSEANLAQHVSVLRKLLSDTGGVRRFIVSVSGKGYRFIPRVTRANDAARPAFSNHCE